MHPAILHGIRIWVDSPAFFNRPITSVNLSSTPFSCSALDSTHLVNFGCSLSFSEARHASISTAVYRLPIDGGGREVVYPHYTDLVSTANTPD